MVRDSVMNVVQPPTFSRTKTSNHESEDAEVKVSTLVSRISDQSISDVDGLIEGLQGLRRKLDDGRDRLEQDIRFYAAFSQSVVELANIVSEGMAAIKSPDTIPGIGVASREHPAK
jgi:hypothetical protein